MIADKQIKRKWPKRLLIACITVLIACGIGFYAYTSDYYHAGEDARALTESLESAGSLQETDASIAVGASDAEVGVVFYPGAKVDPQAYVPLANELADRGYYCVIAKMPFNLAFFGIDSASSLIDSASEIDEWWIAGHSLGGAMAAQFASAHSNELEGAFLLAAYAASDLSQTDLSVNLIYGSNDGVLNRDALQNNEVNLPSGSVTEVIEGGNHAGFGDYGPQDGDGECSIGAEQQWDATASFMVVSIEAARKS